MNVITWKQIPDDEASARTAALLEIIARAEERLKRQGRTWSVDQDQGRSRIDEKECAAPGN